MYKYKDLIKYNTQVQGRLKLPVYKYRDLNKDTNKYTNKAGVQSKDVNKYNVKIRV